MVRRERRILIRTEASNADFNLRANRTRVLHHGICGSSPIESIALSL
jgi:hypothetical protein